MTRLLAFWVNGTRTAVGSIGSVRARSRGCSTPKEKRCAHCSEEDFNVLYQGVLLDPCQVVGKFFPVGLDVRIGVSLCNLCSTGQARPNSKPFFEVRDVVDSPKV